MLYVCVYSVNAFVCRCVWYACICCVCMCVFVCVVCLCVSMCMYSICLYMCVVYLCVLCVLCVYVCWPSPYTLFEMESLVTHCCKAPRKSPVSVSYPVIGGQGLQTCLILCLALWEPELRSEIRLSEQVHLSRPTFLVLLFLSPWQRIEKIK